MQAPLARCVGAKLRRWVLAIQISREQLRMAVPDKLLELCGAQPIAEGNVARLR
jgi:hypothetical protein